MKLAFVLSLLCLPLMLAGCSPGPANAGNSGSEQPRGSIGIEELKDRGILQGTVSKGPLSPASPPGVSGNAPVPRARVDIAKTDGKSSMSVETDTGGKFRVALAPGTYTITMPSLHGAMFSKDLPASVTIAPGQEQSLTIVLDTGIR